MRSVIMREDTAVLSVVRPEALLVDDDAVLSARERAERDARRAGYTAGLSEARAETEAASQQAHAEQASVLQALEGAVAQARKILESERPRLEHAAVELAFQIAQAVLARELKLAVSPGLDAVRRAIAEAPETTGAVIRMNPVDVQALGDASQLGESLTVVPDPDVGAGGCILEVGAALVDARIEASLERVRKVLDEATAQR
jgi:flagellar assembly protein FliH